MCGLYSLAPHHCQRFQKCRQGCFFFLTSVAGNVGSYVPVHMVSWLWLNLLVCNLCLQHAPGKRCILVLALAGLAGSVPSPHELPEDNLLSRRCARLHSLGSTKDACSSIFVQKAHQASCPVEVNCPAVTDRLRFLAHVGYIRVLGWPCWGV